MKPARAFWLRQGVPYPEGERVVNKGDEHLLHGAPRLFGIVADPEDDNHPQVVAWGHELPDQAVLTWRLGNGGTEVAVFSSAEAALATAELLYSARLLWPTNAQRV
jgi:hypothetical protein